MIEIKDTRDMMANAKFFEGYSRFDEEKGRYANWDESVDRVMDMHKEKYKDKMNDELKSIFDDISKAYKEKLFLGAQRALQFGGEQLLKHQIRMYNCVSSYTNRAEYFGEFMYMLLCGAGAGFSVQWHHIAKIPKINNSFEKGKRIHVIDDSIEGWADSIDVLLSSYFEDGGKYPDFNNCHVQFNYDEIRKKGSKISGGFKAPGAEPLKNAIEKIRAILDNISDRKLKPIEAYDICMHMADAVLSGGIRRAATICLFSKDDIEMIKAKTGNWFKENPQRGRSNNSAVLLRSEITFEEFKEIMKSVEHSGEPGFIFTDSTEFTYNPCVEIGKIPTTDDGRTGWQGCCLTEINGGKSNTPEEFYYQCYVASAMNTLQAGYTDFKFLSPAAKECFEKEALIGVSVTGWMDNPKVLFDTEVMNRGAEIVKETNKRVAKLIGINQAARTTCVKPSGNASVLLGTGSGIHGQHSKRYLRHVQFNIDTEIAQLFIKDNPHMVETSVWSANGTDVVVAFPIVPTKGSILKNELLGVKQLEYVKKVQQNWVENGTNVHLCRDPRIRHNVSNTITVDDWDEVTKYVFDNKESLCGISFLSARGDKAYPQAPNTEILDMQDIINKYGTESLFTSALIEHSLRAYNQDLWAACTLATEDRSSLEDTHANADKLEWLKRFDKFSKNFKSKEDCVNCLKDVYNLHKVWKINDNLKQVDWTKIKKPRYTEIDTMGAQACAGGQCEI
jgi:ribonucleoside-triphosphate reductase (thioredoxin)